MHRNAFRTAFILAILFQHMAKEHEKVPQVQASHAMFELLMPREDLLFRCYQIDPSTWIYLVFLIETVQCNDLVRSSVPCAATNYKVLLHACVLWPQA